MSKQHRGPILVATALAVLLLPGRGAEAATGDPVLINEVLASHTGTDDTEYVELFGMPGAALGGLSLIVVEGDSTGAGTIDRRIDFGAGDLLGANGFFLLGNPSGLAVNYGVTPDLDLGANAFENSSLTLALVETASLAGGAVAGTEVVLDAVALDDGDAGDSFFFGAPVVGPDGSFFPAGVRRLADGVDTDTAADWALADFFLGSANTPTAGDALPPPPPLVATIMEIQGSGQFSPLEGEQVTTSGVVTLFTANGRNLWLQDPLGDGDPATSDGIFVSGGGDVSGAPVPQVGDLVTVTATVEEQQFGTALPLTRLTGVSALEIEAPGQPLPQPVVLTDLPNESLAAGIAFWEPLEGMLVTLSDGRVVAPTTRFGEFALLTEADADADLGSGYFAQAKQVLIGGSTDAFGDNGTDYNPERILVDDGSLDEAIAVRPGDRISWLDGVVDYTFGAYKLQPAGFAVRTHDLPNGTASRRSGGFGDSVITSFNVENLFDLVDNPDKDDGGSTPEPEELEVQLAKLALAIEAELELPDILVVQEVENTAILQELGDLVNTATGADYQAVSFETSDGRGIEVGFLWDARRVTLLDAFQLSGPDVEAAFGPSSPSPGREPLAGVFDIGGRELTIVGNHFKSKGGDDPLFSVNDPPVRVTEVQRKAQARVVRAFVDGLVAADPSALVMVTGDLNDFQFGEPGEGADHPLAILEGGGGPAPFANLIETEKPAERYSFVFDGNSQVLDHMLVSAALLERFVALDVLHFNAGFPSALGADPATALRASDHDAVEGRFLLW